MANIFAAALSMGGGVAFAQDSTDQPAAFSADEMTHDKELGVITARGNVEVNQGPRTLLADTISYNQGKDIITAKGNVALHQPNGDIIFADFMEISGDLKNGLIEDLRALLADRSRAAAKKATLVNDETMTLDRAIYTRCEPCEEDPSRPPLWQLKSIKIVHDRKRKIVEYIDSWMEFAGVPVFYTPYISTPDPTVKRKSGLLAPSFQISSDIGAMATVPYFYVIDDQADVTVTPTFSSGIIHGGVGEYRQKFTNGELSFTGSAARASRTGNSALTNETRQTMGHVVSNARFDLNDTWRVGADIGRTNNDTYMRRYGFGNDPTLTSQAYLEGFRGNNYVQVKGMAFQGLGATDNAKTIPLVFPVAQYSHQGDPDRYGAYNTLDANLTMLSREQGVSATRISLMPAWTLPYTAPMGDIYKLTASMGVDFFHADNVPTPSRPDSTYNGAALRVNPQVALDWRWPLARRSGSVTEVVEPIGQVVVSPYGGNSYKMANEDSQDFDFNDANLFSTNRFTGYDRVESGPRANYGVKWSVTGDEGGSTSVLLGQSYRVKKDDTFSVGSGMENNFSDYVGKIDVSPKGGSFRALYRTRVDKDTLAFKRHELGFNGNLLDVSYAANYVYFSAYQNGEFSGREQISYSLGRPLTQYWRTNFNALNDLGKDGGLRSMGLGFVYNDECFNFTTNFTRTFFQDREIKPADAVVFTFVFKTLGEFTTGAITPTSLTDKSK